MKKSIIKAIVFDLDDTLYEERSFVESGCIAVAQYLSRVENFPTETICKDLIMILDRDGRGAIFDTLLKQHNRYSQELVDRLVDIYRIHTPHIVVYPGVGVLLSNLKDYYRLGIITDGLALVQKNKVKALGIGSLFDKIIYTSELGDGKAKPSSYSFQKISDDFKLDPTQLVYIGDNPYKDFIGAKKLGIYTIRILQGMYKDVALEQNYEADHSIKNLQELNSLLS